MATAARYRFMTASVAVAGSALLLTLPAQGVTIRVPADYRTIQAGINAAANGDVILVAPGVYSGTGNRNIGFMAEDVTCVGRGEPQPPSSTSKVIQVTKLMPSTSTEARRRPASSKGSPCATAICRPTPTGGAVLIDESAPIIAQCVFEGNFAGGGGAIYNHQGWQRIEDSSFIGNRAGGGAGAFACIAGHSELVRCTLRGNVASTEGGALYLRGPPAVVDCSVVGNSASNRGGVCIGIPSILTRVQ